MIEDFSGVVAIAGRGGTTVAGRHTTATPFQIASVSKIFAATLVMMLVEDGTLTLHQPITRWLPTASPDLTLHRLLSHTSGIGHWADVPGAEPQLPLTPEDRLTKILAAPPITTWRYSSPGYAVVGAVIERATARPYPQALTERILRPLGLSATKAGNPPADLPPGHHEGAPIDPWDLTSVTGTGDLSSTANDLLTFVTALDGGALVSAESLRTMRTPHGILPKPDRSLAGRLVLTGYGYGTFVGDFDGKPAWLHPGDVPGYTSLVARLPGEVTVVCLANEDTVPWDKILTELV